MQDASQPHVRNSCVDFLCLLSLAARHLSNHKFVVIPCTRDQLRFVLRRPPSTNRPIPFESSTTNCLSLDPQRFLPVYGSFVPAAAALTCSHMPVLCCTAVCTHSFISRYPSLFDRPHVCNPSQSINLPKCQPQAKSALAVGRTTHTPVTSAHVW
jgi:hypothetical protein